MTRFDSQPRLNDTLFALVLAASVAAAGWVAWATRGAAAPATLVAAPATVQLERVVVRGRRLPAVAQETRVELPRVVVRARRTARFAGAAARDSEG